MLYVDAFVSPSGTGITYLGATTRMLFAMSENKHLANPCVTDSTPTSANQEDHVSMAAHG